MQKTKTAILLKLVIIGIVGLPTAYGQVCNTRQIVQTVSIKNFTLASINNGDGSTTATATDQVTNLIWNRCVFGQNWNAATEQCIGSPILLSWKEALQTADQLGSGWRLPNIMELSSILDLQCINPPYNLTLFPDTFASENHGLWTSSPHVDTEVGQNNPVAKTNAWYIDLSSGKLNYRDIGDDIKTKNFVRFVK